MRHTGEGRDGELRKWGGDSSMGCGPKWEWCYITWCTPLHSRWVHICVIKKARPPCEMCAQKVSPPPQCCWPLPGSAIRCTGTIHESHQKNHENRWQRIPLQMEWANGGDPNPAWDGAKRVPLKYRNKVGKKLLYWIQEWTNFWPQTYRNYWMETIWATILRREMLLANIIFTSLTFHLVKTNTRWGATSRGSNQGKQACRPTARRGDKEHESRCSAMPIPRLRPRGSGQRCRPLIFRRGPRCAPPVIGFVKKYLFFRFTLCYFQYITLIP